MLDAPVSGPLRRFDDWMAHPAPPERLAAFRILLGTFAVAYVGVRVRVFARLADGDADDLEPVGVLWWLEAPLPALMVVLLIVTVLVCGLLFIGGIAFRFAAPAFAIALLVLTTYRSSQGQLLWFENLAVIHVLLVAVSPAADVWCVGPANATRRRVASPSGERYGWWLRLVALVTVCTYVVAGVAKLRTSGLSWVDGESLRNHMAFSAARLEVLGASPPWLAARIIEQTWMFAPMAVAVLILELGAPAALISGWPRRIVVGGLFLMHVSIALTMHVVFPYHLALLGFAPLFRLERALRWPFLAR